MLITSRKQYNLKRKNCKKPSKEYNNSKISKYCQLHVLHHHHGPQALEVVELKKIKLLKQKHII